MCSTGLGPELVERFALRRVELLDRSHGNVSVLRKQKSVADLGQQQ